MLEPPRSAFRAGAERLLLVEIGRLIAAGVGSVAEIELEAKIVGQPQARGKRPALLAAKTGQRTDESLADQLGHFLRRPVAPKQHRPDVEVAFLALELAVGL